MTKQSTVYCPNCDDITEIAEREDGIGWSEYWGIRSFDSHMTEVCSACGEDADPSATPCRTCDHDGPCHTCRFG